MAFAYLSFVFFRAVMEEIRICPICGEEAPPGINFNQRFISKFYDESIIYFKYIFVFLAKKQAVFFSINPMLSTFHKIVSGVNPLSYQTLFSNFCCKTMT